MASFRKRGDKWQARVHRKDHSPVVKSFNTKADAFKWARHTESQLDLGTLAPKAAMPRLDRIVERYLTEVTPTKKGAAQELNRGRQIARTSLGSMHLDKITSEVVSKYRDGRLREVSNNTVRLELAFISVVFGQCGKEWGYKVSNPVKQIRIPKPGKPRQRRLRPGEEDALLAACAASSATYLHSLVVLAIETGMRFGELVSITWDNVDFGSRTVYLADTKNGHSRTVPLSTRAIEALHRVISPHASKVFAQHPGTIRAAFAATLRQLNDPQHHPTQALRFHDLRHEAVTRLFEKGLNPIEVGMISGHRSMSMLQRYAHLRAEDLVRRLG
jgi:integrase